MNDDNYYLEVGYSGPESYLQWEYTYHPQQIPPRRMYYFLIDSAIANGMAALDMERNEGAMNVLICTAQKIAQHWDIFKEAYG